MSARQVPAKDVRLDDRVRIDGESFTVDAVYWVSRTHLDIHGDTNRDGRATFTPHGDDLVWVED